SLSLWLLFAAQSVPIGSSRQIARYNTFNYSSHRHWPILGILKLLYLELDCHFRWKMVQRARGICHNSRSVRLVLRSHNAQCPALDFTNCDFWPSIIFEFP